MEYTAKSNPYVWEFYILSLQWRHDKHDGFSNHQPRDCLLTRLFRHRWKKTSELRVTGLCAGNSPVTGEFPAQRASNAEKFPFYDVIMIAKHDENCMEYKNNHVKLQCVGLDYFGWCHGW